MAEILIMLPAALVDNLAVIAAAVVLSGLFAAPMITARSLALRLELPDGLLAAGFSSLYAVNGAGYGVAGLAIGALLPTGAGTAWTAPLATALLMTLVLGRLAHARPTVDG